jgi:hypothetical protein
MCSVFGIGGTRILTFNVRELITCAALAGSIAMAAPVTQFKTHAPAAIIVADPGNGKGKGQDKNNDPVIAPVPEPSSVILFGTVAVAAGWFARKKMQARRDS